MTVSVSRKEGDRVPAKLVFIRNKSNRNDYLVLLSSDISITEDKSIQTYGSNERSKSFSK